MLENSLKNIEGMATQAAESVLIAPELIVILAMLIVIVAGIFLEGRRAAERLGVISLFASALALVLVVGQFMETAGVRTIFAGNLVVDRLGLFFKGFALAATCIVILMSLGSRSIARHPRLEYYAMLLAGTLGAMLVAGSANWLMLYLGLETLSMSSYLLCGYLRGDSRSAEASVKYLIYGATASAFLLFGISYLYGLTGTLDITATLSLPQDSLIAQISLMLVFVGIAFKIAAFPFHFWAPDVYQGAPTAITAYLAVASKAAGFIAAIRVFLPGVSGTVETAIAGLGWEPLFWFAAILTMSLGNLVALRQTSLKRLLAYSSIAHAGYLMMALTVPTREAIEGMMMYLFAYLIMNLGAFLVVVQLESRTGTDEIGVYTGLIRRRPVLVVVLAILLFSLTGLPPTVGFVGKLLIFGAVIEAALANPALATFYYTLALAGAINTAISLAYYMGILKVMVLSSGEADKAPAEHAVVPWAAPLAACTVVLGAATIWFGLFWSGLREAIQSVLVS